MWRALAAATVAALAVACNPPALLEGFSTSAEARFAEESFAMLAERDFDALTRRMSEELRTEDTRKTLEEMAGLVPGGSRKSKKLVGYQWLDFDGQRQVNVTLEYEYTSFVLVNVVVWSKGDRPFLLKGMHVQPMEASLEKQNAFGLGGKSLVHYAMLLLAPAVALLVLAALVICIRTRIPRRKWLWVLFVLFGFGQFQLNWTTGQIAFLPVSLQLFSAGAQAAGPYAPWILSVSFPLGAVVFLARRRRWSDPQDPPPEAMAEVFS
jgi:hypothetical protein